MENPEQKLADCRARIDAIDRELARLLVERIGIIREVGVLKAEHWPNACHIRPAREGQMHHALAKRFEDSGFPPLMALAIWRQLIGGSTHLESPLNVTYLATHPEHQFLAREYFGVQIGAAPVDSLDAALAQIKAGGSNILLLPAPGDSDWWKNGAKLAAQNLLLFAELPVVANNLPVGVKSAVALAAIAPEDSGNDISYFLGRDGALHVVDGFATTHNDDLFLGAHPRPVTLNFGVPRA